MKSGNDTTRRRLLLAGLATFGLAGCGFHLRGQLDMPFKRAYLNANRNERFMNRIARQLEINGVVLTERLNEAEVSIRLFNIKRERDILSLNRAGKAREYRLLTTLTYAVERADGTTVRPAERISVRRDVTYDDTQLLAKDQEEAMLYRDMEDDIAQQLVRRLAAVKLDAPAAQ
ncbi:LPS assembly lipoprotein LptE [Zoogloeaceae bacterium G21618-S1]|nr:LPS assembly lipoprotein LptE [Zoogloeaceae bacterium G21618-S1]